jgi:hypothetical protein
VPGGPPSPFQVCLPAPVRRAAREAPRVTNEVMVQPPMAPAVQAQLSWTPSALGLQAGTVASIGRPAAFWTVQVNR